MATSAAVRLMPEQALPLPGCTRKPRALHKASTQSHLFNSSLISIGSRLEWQQRVGTRRELGRGETWRCGSLGGRQ